MEGKKCGIGKFTYASGNVYEGEYKDGKPNGQVIFKTCFVLN